MRKFAVLLASTAFFVLPLSLANAATFDWSYTDGGSNSGSGTLTADLSSPGVYDLDTITGTANGFAVTGPSTYAFDDNVIYFSPTAPTHFDPTNPFFFVDFAGIAFITSGGTFNIYEGTIGQPVPYNCGDASPYCLIGPGVPGGDGVGTPTTDPIVALTDFSLTEVAATPLPAALPLFAGGLGIFGLFGARKRRKVLAT
jgi:hypothetical protein